MVTNLEPLARYFWDYEISSLNWEQHQDFIVKRILQYGDLPSLRWLRAQIGDTGLREWIVKRKGSGLSPRQIRYWAIILDIEPALADEWVKSAANTIWERRR
jgi:hypothetical protein